MLICVTNRKLCTEDFLLHIQKIAAAGVDAVILREKDLSEKAYRTLALECRSICTANHTPLILNSFLSVAIDLQLPLQIPLWLLKQITPERLQNIPSYGVSIHSCEEAIAAEEQGASWLIAGHIFPTNCKKDLPPRGLSFLKEICNSVQIPVYAIGGMTAERQIDVLHAGASGCCVMSGLMQCHAPHEYIKIWKC